MDLEIPQWQCRSGKLPSADHTGLTLMIEEPPLLQSIIIHNRAPVAKRKTNRKDAPLEKSDFWVLRGYDISESALALDWSVEVLQSSL